VSHLQLVLKKWVQIVEEPKRSLDRNMLKSGNTSSYREVPRIPLLLCVLLICAFGHTDDLCQAGKASGPVIHQQISAMPFSSILSKVWQKLALLSPDFSFRIQIINSECYRKERQTSDD
jgi:hypothetical protein